ncbi:MAG TPA: site-specific integrase [Kofleriaceae bacterium]|nr:site-specific integrase [Kofleriaceae bacterium]
MSGTVLHQILSRAGFSPVTREKYRGVINRWIAYAGSDPKGWTREKAQDFYDALLDEVTVPSANQYMASLRYVSKWYATRSGDPNLDFAIVQRQRGKGGRRPASPVLGEEEIATLLTKTMGAMRPVDLRDFAMFVVALETGMRRMSLRGMMLQAITYVATKGYTIAHVPIKGAGGEEFFDVPLSDTALEAMKPWRAWLADRPRKLKEGPVFRHVSGATVDDEPPSLTGINDIVAARAIEAGLRHINPHMFRHTFITSRTIAGLTPLEIGTITGHKPGAITVDGVKIQLGAMGTYMHAQADKARNSTPAWLADLVNQLVRRTTL